MPPVVGEPVLTQEAVGGLIVPDPPQRQFVGQAALPRPKEPLHPASRLGAVGRDERNAQFSQGPLHLGILVGLLRSVRTLAGARGDQVAALVRVEAAEDALRLDGAMPLSEAAFGVLLRDEHRIVDLAGRIIEDQPGGLVGCPHGSATRRGCWHPGRAACRAGGAGRGAADGPRGGDASRSSPRPAARP